MKEEAWPCSEVLARDHTRAQRQTHQSLTFLDRALVSTAESLKSSAHVRGVGNARQEVMSGRTPCGAWGPAMVSVGQEAFGSGLNMESRERDQACLDSYRVY